MPKIKLIKNRSDIGAGTRGSDLGIDAIEIAAINAKNDYFMRFPFTDVKTRNETIYNKVNNAFAKRVSHVREHCEAVAKTTKEVLNQGFFPIVLSGDHSSALGTISGIKAYAPQKRLGVIWVDAHADLHSPYTSPSGNIHGMPLAAALGKDNLAFQINEVSKKTAEEWEKMKQIASDTPKVRPEDLLLFGVRDTEAPENKLMETHNIRNYPVHEIRYRGLEQCVNEGLGQLADCELLYLSFDVDSMDCDAVSHGTGTPVQKGFMPKEVLEIMKLIIASQKICCLELTEVNPLLDTKGNKMAETAFDVLNKLTDFYLKTMG